MLYCWDIPEAVYLSPVNHRMAVRTACIRCSTALDADPTLQCKRPCTLLEMKLARIVLHSQWKQPASWHPSHLSRTKRRAKKMQSGLLRTFQYLHGFSSLNRIASEMKQVFQICTAIQARTIAQHQSWHFQDAKDMSSYIYLVRTCSSRSGRVCI